jgi:hypothetical protein
MVNLCRPLDISNCHFIRDPEIDLKDVNEVVYNN